MDFFENHSAVCNNSTDSNLLNVNSENGHLTVISPLAHSTPVIEQSMTTINNIQHEASTGNLTKDNILSNNSAENFSEDVGIAMTESINLLNSSNNNLSDETTSNSAVTIDNFKTLNGNSLPEIETNIGAVANDSFSKTINSSLTPAVNIKCSPLKTEIADINPINTSCDNSTELTDAGNQNCVNNSIAEDSKNSENVLCSITMDIVDFSFKDSEDISNNISGNSTDDVSKMPDSSINYSIEEVINRITDLNLVEDHVGSEDVTVIHSTSKELESYTNIAGEDVEGKSASKILENINATENTIGVLISSQNLANDVHVDTCNVDSFNKMFENPVGNFCNVDSVLKVSENPMTNTVVNFSNVDSVMQEVENSDKLIEDFSNVHSISEVPENPINNSAGDFSIDVVDQVVENEINKSNRDFSVADTSSQKPENPIRIPIEGFSHTGIEFKVPENPLNKKLEVLDDNCTSFKKSENVINAPACVFNVDSMNNQLVANDVEQVTSENFASKTSENQCNNPIDQLLDVDFGFKIPENPVTNGCDEEFTDAVQFFKDPNSFQFLENIKTSVQPESAIPRSSLYVKFDPLHSKFSPNVPIPDNCALISAAVKETHREVSEKSSPVPEVVNKHLVDVSVRESTGNVLISFDSPKPSVGKDVKTPVILSPPKLYTEDELQQKLKIHELTTQEVYLKKQREMESQIIKRDNLLKIQKIVIEELLSVMTEKSDEFKKTRAKIELFETENKKLKEDLKTSTEDLQSVENTFADFHKRYEQCKSMLKTYKENDERLKQVISDLQNKIKEHEQMYCMLQERTEEMLEKANSEVTSVTRAGEAQVTVLKAQLKKAEMKISSLESDIKQIKIENSQLGGICDDLMAKVSRP